MPHIAEELGYFKEEDLEVTIKHFESGSINSKALLARAVDLSDVETSAILSAVANGADLRIFGTHEWGLHFVFLCNARHQDAKRSLRKAFRYFRNWRITSRCHNGPYEEREFRCRAASAASDWANRETQSSNGGKR